MKYGSNKVIRSRFCNASDKFIFHPIEILIDDRSILCPQDDALDMGRHAIEPVVNFPEPIRKPFNGFVLNNLSDEQVNGRILDTAFFQLLMLFLSAVFYVEDTNKHGFMVPRFLVLDSVIFPRRNNLVNDFSEITDWVASITDEIVHFKNRLLPPSFDLPAQGFNHSGFQILFASTELQLLQIGQRHRTVI